MEVTATDWAHATKPSALGWWLAGSGPVLITAGLIRADQAMVGLGSLFLLLFSIAYLHARFHGRRMRCGLLLPRHVEAERAFGLRMRIRNEARFLDAWCVTAELRIAGGSLVNVDLFRLPAGGMAVLDLESTIHQRGEVQYIDLILHSHAPFGLMRTKSSCQQPVRLLVRPRPVWPWRNQEQGRQGSHPGEHSWLEGWQSEGEPRGMRPWQAGDKPRSIVWPASLRSIAQGGSWMVRDADPPGNGWAGYTVVFHSYGGGGSLIRPGRFEEAMGHVAGVVRGLTAQGRRVSFLADFNDWKPCEYRSLKCVGTCLDMLALAQRCAGTEAHEIIEVIDRVPAGEGLIVLSDFPTESWLDVLPAHQRKRPWTRPEKRSKPIRKAVAR